LIVEGDRKLTERWKSKHPRGTRAGWMSRFLFFVEARLVPSLISIPARVCGQSPCRPLDRVHPGSLVLLRGLDHQPKTLSVDFYFKSAPWRGGGERRAESGQVSITAVFARLGCLCSTWNDADMDVEIDLTDCAGSMRR
jgi:hypothetical protein